MTEFDPTENLSWLQSMTALGQLRAKRLASHGRV